jgi:hypothetical protein
VVAPPASLSIVLLACSLVPAVFVSERRLPREEKLENLSGVHLGVEGNHWMQRIIGKITVQEPLHVATGGAPLCLRQIVEDDLNVLK